MGTGRGGVARGQPERAKPRPPAPRRPCAQPRPAQSLPSPSRAPTSSTAVYYPNFTIPPANMSSFRALTKVARPMARSASTVSTSASPVSLSNVGQAPLQPTTQTQTRILTVVLASLPSLCRCWPSPALMMPCSTDCARYKYG